MGGTKIKSNHLISGRDLATNEYYHEITRAVEDILLKYLSAYSSAQNGCSRYLQSHSLCLFLINLDLGNKQGLCKMAWSCSVNLVFISFVFEFLFKVFWFMFCRIGYFEKMVGFMFHRVKFMTISRETITWN